MKKRYLLYTIFAYFFATACDNNLQCERHYIPNGYIGKVEIHFNQKGGQHFLNKEGCIVYTISNQGQCNSSLPFKSGTVYPGKTFRYFEIVSKDSVNEIYEFSKKDYIEDSLARQKQKFVFITSSGHSGDDYKIVYYVDYGKNYRSHLYY